MRRIVRHAVAGIGVCAVGVSLVATTWTGTAATEDEVSVAAPVVVTTPVPLDALAGRNGEAISRDQQRAALSSSRQLALTGQREKIAQREAAIQKEKAAAAKRKAAAKAAAKKKAEAARKARIKALGYEPGTTDPKSIAKQIMANTYGWGSDQFSCYNNIIMRESMWDLTATNASSGAYGIPQALPGSKMASAGSDWRTNPATQIRWGLDYVKDRYGSPCSAWGFKSANGWY